MSLVPEYDDSLSSSGDSSEVESEEEVVRHSEKPKLPKPDFLGTSTNVSDTNSSVFKNPFTEAENEKEKVLQKHVKMIDSKDNMRLINGVKVCWNYRKGRCRFGHKCKYAHDSDVQMSKEEADEKQQTRDAVYQSRGLAEPSDEEIKKIQDEAITQNTQKRKRSGLTQGLIPGKKVLKNYVKHK